MAGRIAFIPLQTTYSDPSAVPAEVARISTGEIVVHGGTGRTWYKTISGTVVDTFIETWKEMMGYIDDPGVDPSTDVRFADLTTFVDSRVAISAGGAALTAAMNDFIENLTADNVHSDGNWGNAVNLVEFIRTTAMGDLTAGVSGAGTWGSIGAGALNAYVYNVLESIQDGTGTGSATTIGDWRGSGLDAETGLFGAIYAHLGTLTKNPAGGQTWKQSDWGWGTFDTLKAYVWEVLNAFGNNTTDAGSNTIGGWRGLAHFPASAQYAAAQMLHGLGYTLDGTPGALLPTKWDDFQSLEYYVTRRSLATLDALGSSLTDDDSGDYSDMDNWGDFANLTTYVNNIITGWAGGAGLEAAVEAKMLALGGSSATTGIIDHWGDFPNLKKFVYNCLCLFVDGTGSYETRGQGEGVNDKFIATDGFLAGLMRAIPKMTELMYVSTIDAIGTTDYDWSDSVFPAGTRDGSVGACNTTTDTANAAIYVRRPSSNAVPSTNRAYDSFKVDPYGKVYTHGGFCVYKNGSSVGWTGGSGGVGGTGAVFQVDTDGNCEAAAYNTTSLRATKKDIAPYVDDAEAIINSVDVCTFKFIDSETDLLRVGFIADDTDSVLSGENHDKFDLNNTVGVLLRAVQQLSAKVEGLQAEVAGLKGE